MLRRLLLATLLVGGASALPIAPSSASTPQEDNLAAIIIADHNEARIANGLEPLSLLEPLADYTDANSDTMATTGSLARTDLNTVMAAMPSATWAGENTAVMFDAATEATAIWLDSKGHADTLMASYATHVYASVTCSADGRLWATVMFVEDVAAPKVAPPAPTATTGAEARCARPVEPFRSTPDFVAQQYRDFLGREPEDEGINYWVTEMENGRIAPTQLMAAFMGSPEFAGRVAPVVRVHIAATGQLPSASQLKSGLAARADGSTIGELADAALSSPSGVASFGALENEAFLHEAHRQMFGRRATTDELSGWIGALHASASRGQVLAALANSAEYQQSTSATVQVYMAYAGMLERAPDAAGLTYWAGIVEGGGSIEVLLDGFVSSNEYRNRF
jgi:hypothetical protein